MEDDTILKIDLIRVPLGELAKLVMKCVEFMETYAKAKSFWKRLRENAFSDSSNIVATYNNGLDLWTQRCRDLILGKIHRDVVDVLGPVNRIQQVVRDIQRGVEHIEDETCLNKLAYANGAGLDSSKTCLENTRMSILLEIVNWVHSASSDTQRVLWLHGQAGKGKSAIAHTIAKWFEDVGELGSCFCFAQDQQADVRHKKIFATIARDLSDHNPNYKRALTGIIANTSNSLIHSSDKSMDEISSEIVKRDIQLYISSHLESSGYGLPETAVTRLAEMSDGLFEWARLACEFIRFPKEAATPMERYDDLLLVMGKGGAGLLDKMYETILGDVIIAGVANLLLRLGIST
ncbi:hypothetical protein ID866_11618 [Astraeus odoratus]|nr:hypothetical protein ID866_11618 [Astraeus odoratus]